MQDMLHHLATYGYIGLFIYSLGGGFVALMAASVLSYMGKMDLATSMVIAFTANVIGDNLLFYLARNQKEILYTYLKKHRRKLALAHLKMKQYGSWIILIQKFIYGIKTLIPIAIGLTKYDLKKFTILNILSAVIWTFVIGLGSFYFGGTLMHLYGIIISKPYIAIIVVLLLIILIWIYLTLATRKK